MWWKSKPGKDVPFLENWEIKGPFPDKRSRMIWEPVRKTGSWRKEAANDDGYVALGEKEHSISYARHVFVVEGTTDALLWIGADDGFVVTLDDKVIFAHHTRAEAKPDDHAIPLRLAKGEHTLLLKIVNELQETAFYARLTDRQGRKLK